MTIDLALDMPRPARAGTAARRRRMTRTSPVTSAIGHVIMVVLSFFCLLPIYWMLVTSLRPVNKLFEAGVWPSTPSLDNYRYALNAIPIWQMLANTLAISAVVTALQLLTGLLTAFAFSRYKFPLDKLVYSLIALTWLVPFQVVMIPNYLLVAQMGLLDSVTALVLPHFASALAILLLAQAMRSFPTEVIEAARLDGARSWRILWEVVVPSMRGTLASLAILVFISTWNEYFWPLLLTRTAENSVIQIGIQMFMSSEGNAWGPLMAASTMASLPILVLYIILQKQVVQSFMKSGIR